jgi:hypothetical protein
LPEWQQNEGISVDLDNTVKTHISLEKA